MSIFFKYSISLFEVRPTRLDRYHTFYKKKNNTAVSKMNSYIQALEGGHQKNAELKQQINNVNSKVAQLRSQASNFRANVFEAEDKSVSNQNTLSLLESSVEEVRAQTADSEEELRKARAHTAELSSEASRLRSDIRRQKEEWLGVSLSALLDSVGSLDLTCSATPEIRRQRLTRSHNTPEQPTGAGNGDTPHPGTGK